MRLSGSKFVKRTVVAVFALTVACTAGAVELAGNLDHSARSAAVILADGDPTPAPAAAPVVPANQEWGH
ncbi:hypothetical protein CFP65_3419 [Kitasatospora sp. MMS16-BH015]|uniref:hypothetical protein n=1 Tax=Kitasatospora sp. MMS16-BH015 TaxID=2018025 RepID=UPI000CA3D568|nr:hypothetical protein [Kitasatospora sp. MMS16-BH015]AUG78215.1 hypothetical protein CFP65_3419 [Kitasatospora sp. MMS16-BH015]